jgi:hypothetical protein
MNFGHNAGTPNIPAQVDTSTRQRNNDRGTTSDGRKANDPTGITKKQVMATQPRGSARINDQFCSGGGKTNCSMEPKIQNGTMIRSHPPRKATSDQPRGPRPPDRFSRIARSLNRNIKIFIYTISYCIPLCVKKKRCYELIMM